MKPQSVGGYVCDVMMWEGLTEAADVNVPMPAWPTIQDILMNSMTPQMLSMQRTYTHTHASDVCTQLGTLVYVLVNTYIYDSLKSIQ